MQFSLKSMLSSINAFNCSSLCWLDNRLYNKYPLCAGVLISPPSSARNTINLLHNNNGNNHHIIIPHTPCPPDILSDEYHEDEDTLSLENLFPCDQSEIYASKKISFIIDEVIQTEANYVNNLRKV
ncbi:unnamed protein product [Ceratitis capitata]|uniref:(Mediterranean fruit fly) hypothetical protein n=1 Tax=Ceratitis capitata TaxID=7213 RepID=A0A811V9Q2_CERCA|nr:unnamed protein product [Ceratitis capitata]